MSPPARRLLSGSTLLTDAARPERSFGSVSGETGPAGTGLVHAVLDAQAYRARFAGGLSISMTESAAATLANGLSRTTVRLEQLRGLSRIGALQNDFGASPEEVWREPALTLAPAAALAGAVELPEPLDEPRFALGRAAGEISYTAETGPVWLTFQDVVAVVQTTGTERTVVGTDPDRAWTALVENRLSTDRPNAEQFRFQSPVLGWEVIAGSLTITTGAAAESGDLG